MKPWKAWFRGRWWRPRRSRRREVVLDLSAYDNQWVAVRGGRVIAHSPNTRDLMEQLRRMGPVARGAVCTFHQENPEQPTIGPWT